MPDVKAGFFPLDKQLHLGDHSWSPQTVKQIVKLGTEIPSYRRAAENFAELTQVGVGKSSIAELVSTYGGRLVEIQQAQAEATVKAPAPEAVPTVRHMPKPDSEIMAVSLDGALVNIRGEGWKEVKVAAISAVETQSDAKTGDPKVRLTHHSYRAGLWEAKTFAAHQWAEGLSRGLERAKQIVSVNDGAEWIWTLVQMCWAPCVEILDWWHLLEKLWDPTTLWFEDDPDAAALWMSCQKQHLWNSNLRQVFRAIRHLCPRGHPLPDKVRLTIGYLFRHRHRLDYQTFRNAGFPIGSGTVESACKLVMQARMKQAGMRWSRPGAQAMLALRAVLLSDRWDDTWSSLFSPLISPK